MKSNLTWAVGMFCLIILSAVLVSQRDRAIDGWQRCQKVAAESQQIAKEAQEDTKACQAMVETLTQILNKLMSHTNIIVRAQ